MNTHEHTGPGLAPMGKAVVTHSASAAGPVISIGEQRTNAWYTKDEIERRVDAIVALSMALATHKCSRSRLVRLDKCPLCGGATEFNKAESDTNTSASWQCKDADCGYDELAEYEDREYNGDEA